MVTKGEDQCSCGAPYSTLHNIEGRTNDRILFQGGPSRPPGPIFDFIEEEATCVQQYQLVQERLDLVILKQVLLDEPASKELTKLEETSREFSGPEVEFRIEFVDELFVEPGRKFRPSFCRLMDIEDTFPPD